MSNAHDAGQLVRVQCRLCRVIHNYRPEDLQRLFGDLGINSIERRMRCEQCGRKDYMQVTLWFPTAEERRELAIRRLVRIETKRIPVWRDEY